MNIWLSHCKKYQEQHPNLKWSEVLKQAGATYERKGSKKIENETVEKKHQKRKKRNLKNKRNFNLLKEIIYRIVWRKIP